MKKPIIYCQDETKRSTNKKYCFVRNQEDIQKDIENILDSLGPIYTKKVWIKTSEKEIETYILKQEGDLLITIQNEKIPINDILAIKRIS